MRASSALFWLSTVLTGLPAHAEKRVFIIATNADGYGVDRCLATGESCGTSIATAYCRAHAFDSALSFRKIEPTEIHKAASDVPCGRGCDGFVAIECTR